MQAVVQVMMQPASQPDRTGSVSDSVWFVENWRDLWLSIGGLIDLAMLIGQNWERAWGTLTTLQHFGRLLVST